MADKPKMVTLEISEEGARSFISDSAGWGAMGLQEITEAIYKALDIEPGTQILPPSVPTPKFKRDQEVEVVGGRMGIVMSRTWHAEGYWQYAISVDGTAVKRFEGNPYKEDELYSI